MLKKGDNKDVRSRFHYDVSEEAQLGMGLFGGGIMKARKRPYRHEAGFLNLKVVAEFVR